jgi:hypothetical protein
MSFDVLCSPAPFLQLVGICADRPRGYTVVADVRSVGARVDEILYLSEYWRMLKREYRADVLWRVFEQNSLIPAYLLLYVTGFL